MSVKNRKSWIRFIWTILAIAIWVFFIQGLNGNQLTTFKLSSGGMATVPNWVFPSRLAVSMIAFVAALLGGIHFTRGFGKWSNWAIGFICGLLVFSFLIWSAADKSLNLTGLLNTTLTKAVPISLGALSGILCERAGVVNIAIEGMMLIGAIVGTIVGSLTGSLWLGLLGAVLAGAFLGWIHAVLSIKYMVDQIISGTVINIFAVGISSYISAKFLQRYEYLNNPGIFSVIEIPILSRIPVLGPIFFNNNLFVYALFFLLIAVHVGLYYTRWGLRLRAVGEHPRAADTLGINVFRTRYMAVILGGMMAGFGGAYFTLGSVGRFDEVMTAGRGFIGLAAMIFGNWNPFGAFGAGLLFGFADSLASKLAILGVPIPSQFLLMAPYIATMLILGGVVGRGQMPAADGQPYQKSK